MLNRTNQIAVNSVVSPIGLLVAVMFVLSFGCKNAASQQDEKQDAKQTATQDEHASQDEDELTVLRERYEDHRILADQVPDDKLELGDHIDMLGEHSKLCIILEKFDEAVEVRNMILEVVKQRGDQPDMDVITAKQLLKEYKQISELQGEQREAARSAFQHMIAGGDLLEEESPRFAIAEVRLGKATATLEELLGEHCLITAITPKVDWAFCKFKQGKNPETIFTLLNQAMATRMRLLGPNHSRVISIRENLGMAYMGAGDTEKAVGHLQAIANESLARYGTNHPFTARTFRSLANVYLSSDRHDLAKSCYEQAARSYESYYGSDFSELVMVYVGLAAINNAMNQHDEAIVNANDAMRIAKLTDDPKFEWGIHKGHYLQKSHWQMSLALSGLQNHEAAIIEIDKALELSDEMEEAPFDKIDCLIAKSNVLRAAGRVEEATSNMLDAKARCEALPSPTTKLSSVHLALGRLTRAQGDLDSAMMHFQKCEQLCSSWTGSTRMEHSAAIYEQALTLLSETQKPDEATVARALQLMRKALSGELERTSQMVLYSTEVDALSFAASAKRIMGSILAVYQSNGNELAKEDLELLLQTKGMVTSLLAKRSKVISLLEREDNSDLRFQFIHARRAYHSGTAADNSDDALNSEAELLRNVLNKLAHQHGAAIGEQFTMRSDLVLQFEKTLQPGIVIVDLFCTDPGNALDQSGEQNCYALIITRNEETLELQVTTKSISMPDIQPALAAYHAELAGTRDIRRTGKSRRVPASMSFDESEKVVSDAIWSVFKDHIPVDHYLAICPDGVLNHIPWPALKTVDEEYLIQRNPIVIWTSASDYLDIVESESKELLDVLAVSDVDYSAVAEDGKRSVVFWRRLAYSAKEIENIALHWPKDKVKPITGSNVTKSDLINELGSYGVVHIATHGMSSTHLFRFFDRTMPEDWEQLNILTSSFLVLSGANKHDWGKLESLDGVDEVITAEQIIDLDLANVSLVVLSACQSGTGTIASGEGVFGLPKAFRIAGAGTVVASLWKVEDRFTSEFMSDFYWGIREENLGKARSLQKAQIAMIKSGKEPKFWASWNLTGDWR